MKTTLTPTALAALLSLALLTPMSPASAQAPTWAWAIDTNGPRDEYLYTTASSPDGSIYALGRFEDSFAMGDVEVEVPAPWTSLVYYPFLSKITSGGEAAWVIPFGEPEIGYRYNGVFGIATDSEDNVYISGQIVRWNAVGAFSVNIAGASFTIPASATADSFIAKIDPDGNGLWVKNLSTLQHPIWAPASSVVVDENDQVFFCVAIQASSFEIDGVVYPIMGVGGLCLARLDENGEFQWAQSMGSEGFDLGAITKPAVGGGLLISGSWAGGTVQVGGLTLEHSGALISQPHDRWIAKFGAGENAEWLVHEGGSGYDTGGLIAPTPAGGAMVLSSNTGAITLNGVTYDVPGALLTRYSSEGELEQVTAFPQVNNGRAITTDGNGQYFLGFNFSGPTFTFGSFQFDNTEAFSQTSDMVIAAVDMNGTPLWGTSVGSSEDEVLWGLDYSPNHGIIASGYFNSSSLSFGDHAMSNEGLFTIDGFLATLDFTSAVADAHTATPLHLYPNPAHSHIAADLHALDHGPHILRIFDTRGSQVMTQVVNGGTTAAIDVGKLTAGNYVVLLHTDRTMYTSKFIKL